MYEHFGFKDNIFNTKPLDLCQEDLQKFIGRVQDIKNFLVDVSSTDSAALLITGHRGVGKTSFINVMEYAIGFNESFLSKYIKINIPNLIPCYYKIQLEPKEEIKSILAKSLSSLLFSIKKYAAEKGLSSKIPKEVKELSDWASELSSSITKTDQLQLGGFGGGLSRSKQYKNLSEVSANVLQEKIKKILLEVKENFKVDGVFLNINNVDIIEEKFFCDIFNQLRDYLLDAKGLWTVIIGQPGIYSSLYQQAARVAEIISGQETKLDPLSEEDIIAVLKNRRRIYSKNSKKLSSLPIEEEFIREIYRNSEGEIRQVFKACDDVVRSVFKINPHVGVIKAEEGRAVLKNILEQQLSLENLKNKDREIIREIFNIGFLRPKDYKKLNLKSAVDFTNKARPLLVKNFLKKEVKGNTAKYKATGIIHLAKYTGVHI